MTKEELPFAEMLLAIKAEAYRGIPWSKDEQASINLCFEKEGEIRILAACCVLSAMRPEGCQRSLGIIRETIERKVPLSPYTELAIYEALTFVRNRELAPFYDGLFYFIEDSLRRRDILLVNTIAVLARLARANEARARVLALLQSLAHDDNAEIRDSALRVIQGIERD